MNYQVFAIFEATNIIGVFAMCAIVRSLCSACTFVCGSSHGCLYPSSKEIRNDGIDIVMGKKVLSGSVKGETIPVKIFYPISDSSEYVRAFAGDKVILSNMTSRQV